MTGEATLAAIRLFVVLLGAAALVAIAVRRTAIPYTVALVVLGLVVGFVVPANHIVVTPELVLTVLVPGLVFEAAYRMDINELRRTFGIIAFLAAPGVIVTAIIVAIGLQVATGLPLGLGLVVGAMVAATDPAAVTATFRRLGSPARLATVVEGESLFNDGTGLVVFVIAVGAVSQPTSLADATIAFVGTVVGSVVIGVVAGWVASRLIALVDDRLIELTLSLVTAYGTYLLADYLHESGVIATVVAGAVLGTYGRRVALSGAVLDVIDVVWEFLAFLLTALVFLLVGLAIRLPSLVEAAPYIAAGVVAVLVGRAVVVYGLLRGVARLVRRRRDDAVPLAWFHVLFWGGLRGAVAVAMALSLPADFPQRQLLQETTFGIVLFTLLVQGTTVDRVITGIPSGGFDPDAA